VAVLVLNVPAVRVSRRRGPGGRRRVARGLRPLRILAIALLVPCCTVSGDGTRILARPDGAGPPPPPPVGQVDARNDDAARPPAPVPGDADSPPDLAGDGLPTVPVVGPPPGGPDAEAPPSDLASCVDRCVDESTLLSCRDGQRACALGCSDAGGPHCRAIIPGGGGVAPADLGVAGVLPITIATSTVVHTDTGAIEGIRPAGASSIANGIGFRMADGIAVFTTAGLTIAPGVVVTVVGPNPVAFVSSGDITVSGIVDARGTCEGTQAGPGGGVGGELQAAGAGLGGGSPGRGVHDMSSGGAGAGHGAAGGSGGPGSGQPAPAAGGSYPMTKLAGGSGGGGGGGTRSGLGGGGGGAIQLVAGGKVTVSGGINAGGCGGKSASDDGGGGGGSGGAILIEAPVVVLASGAVLAVNGGGGGASDGGGDGRPGDLSAQRSVGGTAADNNGAAGGRGGASVTLAGEPGGQGSNGGGGGGGAGRIVLNSLTGAATLDPAAVLSPSLTDPASATVQGKIQLR
jgi:hypothetical protein